MVAQKVVVELDSVVDLGLPYPNYPSYRLPRLLHGLAMMIVLDFANHCLVQACSKLTFLGYVPLATAREIALELAKGRKCSLMFVTCPRFHGS